MAPKMKSAILATSLFGVRILGQDAIFHHRSYHNSIVVGDYLYIDGGETTTWNGEGSGFQDVNPQSDGNIITLPENNTYSVDLTTSWTTSSVVLNTIAKGAAPVLSNEGLWMGPDGATFYMYNGRANWYLPTISEEASAPSNQMWQFAPLRDSGSWSQVSIDSGSNFSSLVRTEESMSTSSPDGLGFALGGWADEWTLDSLAEGDYFYAPGMVVYNSSSQEWYNISSPENSIGMAVGGTAHFVPDFGPEGLLFIFGGQMENTYTGFDWALMYEPVSQRWEYQRTSGQLPPQGEQQCVVGLPGDNGTYEIFLYGGLASHGKADTIEKSGAVFVLSLPSFTWVKQEDTPSFGRFFHTCNVIGNRQMAVVGGMTEYVNNEHFAFDNDGNGQAADPWEKGIGLFDLTEMVWKDGYDAEAEAYVTPQLVKDAITQHPEPDEWASDDVESWFMTMKDPSSDGADSSGDEGDSFSSGSSNSGASSDSSTNEGAIAGGVVGGVVGLAAIGAIAFVLLRRRRRNQHDQGAELPGDERHEYRKELDSPTAARYEVEGSAARTELDGTTPKVELDSQENTRSKTDGERTTELP